MRFAFIAEEKAVFPVRLLFRTLQVSRAGFYAWQARQFWLGANGPILSEMAPRLAARSTDTTFVR